MELKRLWKSDGVLDFNVVPTIVSYPDRTKNPDHSSFLGKQQVDLSKSALGRDDNKKAFLIIL
jgi:hypothetical protein